MGSSVTAAFEELERNVDRCKDRFQTFFEHYSAQLDSQIDALQLIQEQLDMQAQISDPQAVISAEQSKILADQAKQAFGVAKHIVTEHRSLNSSLVKVDKCVEKNFLHDYSSLKTDEFLQTPEEQRNLIYAVYEHLLRTGMLTAAEKLAEDAKLESDSVYVEQFREMHTILNALKSKRLDELESWVDRHRPMLNGRSSPLEFQLHRLRFLSLLNEIPPRDQAILDYVRKFAPFSKVFAGEFKEMMSALLFCRSKADGTGTLKLKEVSTPALWEAIGRQLVREICAELRLPVHSPLFLCLEVGCRCVAASYELRKTLQKGVLDLLTEHKDVPTVAINLGSEYMYHSVFVCPILRQQVRPNNPPVRLNCGHVISRDALSRLTQSSSSMMRVFSFMQQHGTAGAPQINRVKCPYCPSIIDETNVLMLKL